MKLRSLLAAGLLACSLVTVAAAAPVQVDPKLQTYQAAKGVSGNFSSIGSDTLNNLMTLWAEDYAGFYPNVNIQIQGAGSSTAPPALTEGTANFGPMSREMKDKEIAEFEKKYGYAPIAVPVAIDALAVYVNKDNPIEGMTMAEVDAVFSVGRRCGHAEDITRWGQFGLKGAWANRDITIYSRNAVSGTYGYFKEHALCKGDYKPNINEQPGSASVVQGVTESLNGIGYSGIGYITSGVRAVPLGKEKGKYFAASAENAANGTYPLSRFLFIYVNKKPNQPLPPMEREFMKLVLSKQGQETVVKDGYIPLPAAMVERTRKQLGL